MGGPFNDINIPIINPKYEFETDEIAKIQEKLLNIFKKVDLIFLEISLIFYNNTRNCLIFKNIF